MNAIQAAIIARRIWGPEAALISGPPHQVVRVLGGTPERLGKDGYTGTDWTRAILNAIHNEQVPPVAALRDRAVTDR